MKIVGVFCLLLVSASIAWADFNLKTITFNYDASLADSDFYDEVTVNGTANLSVTGGTIGGIACNDNATVQISGGTFVDEVFSETQIINGLSFTMTHSTGGGLTLNDNAIGEIINGNLVSITVNNNSKLDAYGGSFDLSFFGDTMTNIYGGQINFLGVDQRFLFPLSPPDHSRINVYGGALLGRVNLIQNESVQIYGRSFNYDPLGGYYDSRLNRYDGLLTGVWADGTNFSIDVYNQSSYNRFVLHEIPEPCSLLLLVAGFIFAPSVKCR